MAMLALSVDELPDPEITTCAGCRSFVKVTYEFNEQSNHLGKTERRRGRKSRWPVAYSEATDERGRRVFFCRPCTEEMWRGA